MSTEVTVAEALRAFPALERLAAKDLPQKPAWRLGRWIDKLRPIVERYSKQRDVIIRKFGETNKDGVPEVKKEAEAQDGFQREHDELLDQKETVEYDPIPLSFFKRTIKEEGKDVVKDIELNAQDLGRAMKFFNDDVGLGG